MIVSKKVPDLKYFARQLKILILIKGRFVALVRFFLFCFAQKGGYFDCERFAFRKGKIQCCSVENVRGGFAIVVHLVLLYGF